MQMASTYKCLKYSANVRMISCTRASARACRALSWDRRFSSLFAPFCTLTQQLASERLKPKRLLVWGPRKTHQKQLFPIKKKLFPTNLKKTFQTSRKNFFPIQKKLSLGIYKRSRMNFFEKRESKKTFSQSKKILGSLQEVLPLLDDTWPIKTTSLHVKKIHGLKKAGGGWGGRSPPPPICKHPAHMMGVNKFLGLWSTLGLGFRV